MKFEKYRLRGLIVCLFLGVVSNVHAVVSEVVEEELARLQSASLGQSIVSIDSATEVAGFIRFTPGSGLVSTQSAGTVTEKTREFLDNYQGLLGLSDHRSELALVRESTDITGRGRTRYRQVYQGLPVFGAELTSHFNRNGELIAISSSTFEITSLDTTPRWDMAAAGQVARDHVVRQGLETQSKSPDSEKDNSSGRVRVDLTDLTASNGELMVFRTGLVKGVPGRNHLVYRFEVINDTRSVREFVFVDAHTGKVLDQITGIQHALKRQVYEAVVDDLVWQDNASPAHPNPIPPGWDGGTAQQVADWQDEIDGAEESYNLFASMTRGEWLSYDGEDAIMRTINNEPNIGCPNAVWDGVSTNYCSNVTSDDIVAHEWGHAYMDNTANLVYQWQSGALNESYSDIWGEVVDLLNGRGSDLPDGLRTETACSVYGAGADKTDDTYRWLIAEDSSGFGGAIRDMWRPSCYGDPDRVSDNRYWCSSYDSGGVHTNSGIPNRGFALLVDGGTVNEQEIIGLGLTKAAHIYWESLDMLVPVSDFSDQADALEASCTNLIDINLPTVSTETTDGGLSGEVITTEDCETIPLVVAAIELREDPVRCGFSTLLENNPPERCLNRGVLQSISLTDWESGLGSWSAATHDVVNPLTFDTPDWVTSDNLPDEREGSAAFVANLNIGNCDDDDESGALNLDSPLIQLPIDIEAARLSIDHWMSSEKDWDGGNLKISVNGSPFELIPNSAIEVSPYNDTLFWPDTNNTNPLAGEPAYTGGDGGTLEGSWGQTQIILAGIAGAGDEVRLRFDFGVDGCTGAVGWYVDEVEFYSCSEENPPMCGNGVINLEEQCDDGNNLNEDGCTASCEIEEGWQCAGVRSPGVIPDYSFEAGPLGGVWTEFSSNFDTPICDGDCLPNGNSSASDGTYWAFFGGIESPTAKEEGYVSQTITVPVSATELTFDLSLPACDSASDYLEVTIDGTVEFYVNGIAPSCEVDEYVQQTIDLTAYADENPHTLQFYSESFAINGKNTNFFVDNIGIWAEKSVCNIIDGPRFVSDPIEGSTLNFGDQLIDTESIPLSISVENGGTEPLDLSCLVTGNGASGFNLVSCPSQLAVDESSQIEVSCEPSSTGLKTASLDITTNDPGAPQVNFPLSCNGVIAPQQVITPIPFLQVIPANDPVSIDVLYTTSNGNESASGLELRIHWNSGELVFDSLTSVWADDQVSADDACQEDDSNFDNDANTDCYAAVLWTSVDSTFPGEGNTPALLFKANFTGDMSAAASTRINFSAGSLAEGFDFRSKSALVEEETIGPQTLFSDSFEP